MECMKIGYFSEKFPYLSLKKNESIVYPYGGGEIVAYNLAINIAKRGNKVYVFTTSIGPRGNIEKKLGITIYRYGTILKLFRRNISLDLLLKPNIDVDIVHAHICSEPFSLIAALRFVKKMHVPLVVTYHGDTISIGKNPIYKIAVNFHNSVVKKILEQANVIISPSRYYINESKLLRKYKDKIIVIPNGINIEEFVISYSKDECRKKLNLPKDKFIILFLGVLHPKKGPDIIIKAMPKVIKEVPDVKLIIAGDGIMRTELENLSKKLNIDSYIEFVGFIDDKLKPLYYKAADIFCLPSIISSESFGIVNLEAMVCGTPIIASKIGGIPDVVDDNKTGLLVQPRNSEILSDAIIYLLTNVSIRKKMEKLAKEKVKNYSWDKIAEMIEKVYKMLLE